MRRAGTLNGAIACVALFAAMGSVLIAQQARIKRQTFRGLEIAVTGIERAPTARLQDCPPGANTVNAMTRPGEQFAIVSVAFKVLPGFQPAPLKRPSITDTGGITYNTAASFVDVGQVPDFVCRFPFRVPEGTKLKSLQIGTLSIDLTPVEPQKP